MILDHLRGEGFYPDFVRCKGYIGLTGTEVVAILPMLAWDLSRVAGVGVRRSVVEVEGEVVAGTATIVRLAHGVDPLDFACLYVEQNEVKTFGPMGFDRLKQEGPREIVRELLPPRERRRLEDVTLARLSRGRAIAAAAIEDLAREERAIGFISESEFHQLAKDAELYADIARLHSYLSAISVVRADGDGGCNYCCSTSSYVCTSTSCHVFPEVAKA